MVIGYSSLLSTIFNNKDTDPRMKFVGGQREGREREREREKEKRKFVLMRFKVAWNLYVSEYLYAMVYNLKSTKMWTNLDKPLKNPPYFLGYVGIYI